MDIFISYARRDNIAPDLIGAEGFVTSFHNQLLLAFGNRGYEQPSIFRDSEKIANTDQFEPRLRKELDGASILIVILSRNWIHPDREWCHEELNVFANRNLAQLNDRRAVLERIVVVHRHFIEPSKRPDWLGGQVGIKLVEWDKESRKEVFYFDADRGRPCSGKWFDEIGTLAEELEAKLSRVHTLPKTKVDETKNSVEDSPVRPADRYSPTQAVLGRTMPHSRSSPIIFIAEPATDLQQSYDTLRAELGRRGYKMVPDGQLPRNTEAEAVIGAAVAQADLSIHLLGQSLGFTPENCLLPISPLQLKLAGERAKSGSEMNRSFHRIIWAPKFPPGADTQAEVRDPLIVLRHFNRGELDDIGIVAGDKLDGADFVRFSQFVVEHLVELEQRSRSPREAIEGATVYVDHDESDANVADEVAEGLKGLGFSPVLPVLEGTLQAKIRDREEQLKLAQYIVWCWANADDVWVRMSTYELDEWEKKAGSIVGRLHRAVVALPPRRASKDRFRRFPPKAVGKILDATSVVPITQKELSAVLEHLCET